MVNFTKAFCVFCLVKIISLCLGEGWHEVAAQQDAQYSQYMFNQLALNPAFVGSRDKIASSLIYRNQWTGINGAPKTVYFSVQMPLPNKRIGVGAEIISDKIGPKQTNGILLSYAYRIRFSKGKLSFGLRTGIYNYTFNWNEMKYRDSDPYNTGIADSRVTGTGDFGLYYYSRTFYWGMGLNHRIRGKVVDLGNDSAARQAVHLFIPIGKAFQAGNVIINPTLLFKRAAGAPGNIDFNLNVLLKERLWLGMSLRSGYGYVFLIQLHINDHFKAGYSFDYGVNKIGVVGKGSHEIMIGYDFNRKGSKMIMPRYL